jgi:Zn-dependent metalloprotease
MASSTAPSKARPAARKTAAKKAPRAAPAGNGMQRFAMHTQDKAHAAAQRALAPLAAAARRGAAAPAAAAAAGALGQDPETAAFGYLQRALRSADIPAFTDPQGDTDASGFQRLGTETVPLTNTRTVKFRQTVNKVPIYGSLVTVELDQDNRCLAINSSLGAPRGLSAVARISPQQALEVAAQAAGQKAAGIRSTPRLHYYFDKPRQAWALVYIVENVHKRSRSEQARGHAQAAVFDYIVNANTGKLLAETPRTASAAVVETAVDALGVRRTFTAQRNSTTRSLRNAELNISTHAFRFRDPVAEWERMPGTVVKRKPPKAWPPAAVSAHANAEIVGRFLREVLMRDGIDNAGGPMVSTIDCVVADESDVPHEWLNAYWDPDLQQMVYGQRVRAGGLPPFPIAAMLDIVGHEMFHGITDGTARLEYAAQPGALNESYSDIFGVLILNATQPDRSQWQWDVGLGFSEDGRPLRNLKTPGTCDQPAHMDDYAHAGPPRESNDWGHVHTNSGIHNHAAYRVMAANAGGQPVFSHRELAALFYLALTQQLTRTSEFIDSRRALLLVARTLFRSEPAAARRRRTRAIEAAFTAVGIV